MVEEKSTDPRAGPGAEYKPRRVGRSPDRRCGGRPVGLTLGYVSTFAVAMSWEANGGPGTGPSVLGDLAAHVRGWNLATLKLTINRPMPTAHHEVARANGLRSPPGERR